MSKKTPEHPITDEEVAEFKRLVDVWVKRLHITGWRVRMGRRRPTASLAEVEMFEEDRMARIHVGRDWGSNAPKEGELEKVVIHELLHIMLYDLADLAEQHDEERVKGVEHALIHALVESLYEAYHVLG